MAICKHNSAKNGFAAAVEYLTMAHDRKGRLLRDRAGEPIPRKSCLICGIHCTPETFAPLCLQDALRFGKKGGVDTHQYILSFAPSDVEKGLTAGEVYEFAQQFAKENFPGHRTLVCVHDDGSRHAGNIHAHIVISALRFLDRQPDRSFMRLRPDGTVKPSEYRAGYAHQDTGALRRYLLQQVNAYCASRGYAVCPERGERTCSQGEYRAQSGGRPTRNAELRRAIGHAGAVSQSWPEFAERLGRDYTRTVSALPPIPRTQRQQLWERYRASSRAFWSWDKALRKRNSEELAGMYQQLRSAPKHQKAALRGQIADRKAMQRKERLLREIWRLYAKGASTALKSQNQEDALLCLEQMEVFLGKAMGTWQSGWQKGASGYSLTDGTVKSRQSWQDVSEGDKALAEKILRSIQEEALHREALAAKTQEIPMPIEVKLQRGQVFFRHPDAPYWVRGQRLGAAYTLEGLEITPPKSRGHAWTRGKDIER